MLYIEEKKRTKVPVVHKKNTVIRYKLHANHMKNI